MKKVNKLAAILVFMIAGACSTSPKTQVIQMGDETLSAQQIVQELTHLDKTERTINKEKKGVNLTNIAAVLFWPLGLVYTYYDANEALRLIEQRRSHLTNIYNHQYASAPSKNKHS